MRKTTLLAALLSCVAVACWCGAGRSDDPAPEIGLDDLLKLPDARHFKPDPYLAAARSLQAMGPEKAGDLLLKLAAKDEPTKDEIFCARTLTLCRILYKAKPGGTFRRARIGAPGLPGETKIDDWPLEPITIQDGVPFLVVSGYELGGLAEDPILYVLYCTEDCDWNDFQYKPKTKDQERKALDALLSSPKLKGKLKDYEKDFFEAQLK